jgi:hypothetical protein
MRTQSVKDPARTSAFRTFQNVAALCVHVCVRTAVRVLLRVCSTLRACFIICVQYILLLTKLLSELSKYSFQRLGHL